MSPMVILRMADVGSFSSRSKSFFAWLEIQGGGVCGEVPLLVLVDGPFFGFGFDDFAWCFSVDAAVVLLIASSSLLLGLRWI